MKWLGGCFGSSRPMTPNNRFAALAAAAFFLVAPRLHATLAVAASFDEKVENAATIVLGRCVKTESRMDPTGRWILTYSTFQVEKSLKGAAGAEITVVTPGGQVGKTHQQTIGIPQFQEGDEQVLFVKNSSVGPTVLYFDQGAYDVTTDDHGDKIVAPVESSLVKIDQQRGIAVPAEMPRKLTDFQGEVDGSLRSTRERRMQYELIEARRLQKQASLGSTLLRYKYVIAIALLGAALATWQLVRR